MRKQLTPDVLHCRQVCRLARKAGLAVGCLHYSSTENSVERSSAPSRHWHHGGCLLSLSLWKMQAYDSDDEEEDERHGRLVGVAMSNVAIALVDTSSDEDEKKKPRAPRVLP
jgi:hypothetical protein